QRMRDVGLERPEGERVEEHAQRAELIPLLQRALHLRRDLGALLGVGRVDVEKARLPPQAPDLPGDPLGVRERRLAVKVHAEDVEAGASAREAHRLAEARGGAEDQCPAAERDRRRTHVSAPRASVSASSPAPAHRSRRAPPSAATPTRTWKAARPRKKSVRSMPTRLSTSRPRASPTRAARVGWRHPAAASRMTATSASRSAREALGLG